MEKKALFLMAILVLFLLLLGDITTPFQQLAEAKLLEAEAAKLQAQAQLTQTRALAFLAIAGFIVVSSLLVATLAIVWRMMAMIERIDQKQKEIRHIVIATHQPTGHDARGLSARQIDTRSEIMPRRSHAKTN